MAMVNFMLILMIYLCLVMCFTLYVYFKLKIWSPSLEILAYFQLVTDLAGGQTR
jgi:hypothetical protein